MELPLAAGLHELLVTKEMRRALDPSAELQVEFAKVDAADQPHVLARHVYELTRRALEGRADPDARIQLLNNLVALLDAPASEVDAPARQLRRLARAPRPGVIDIESVRPKTPLSDAALLTNTAGEPNLAAELRAEIDTSDEVDLLCAFVKWHGLRLLEDELGRLRRRNAPLRVITTTYMVMWASDPSPSPGSCSTPCRPTSSRARLWPDRRNSSIA